LESSKSLIERALIEISQKKQSIGLLEYAKYYELTGKMSATFKILSHTRKSQVSDWKVFFESVLTYLRNGFFNKAENLVKESLKKHCMNGRLWATLIQLKHAKITTNEESKKAYSVFLQANRKIPKSGEVWCEGARLLMSPVSHKFDLRKAEKYLNFAIQFTPQYGDSFLELFKLYTLKGDTKKIEELKNTCIHSEPNYGILWFYFKHNMNDSALDIWEKATKAIFTEVDELRLIYKAKMTDSFKQETVKSEYWTGYTALNKLYRKGINSVSLPSKSEDSESKLITIEEKWRNIYGFEQIVK